MALILVVDDVRFIAQMMAGIYEEQGHRVVRAGSGPEALEAARNERPDLVCLDIAMPEMDGIDVARELRKDPVTRYTPILMVTSANDRESVARATEAGADDFLAKPFDAAVLLKKSAKLLGGHRMNFSLDIVQQIPVVTVLRTEVVGDIVSELEQALETARGGGGRPMVLDCSRVTKVDSGAAGAVLRVVDGLHREGGTLEVVPPGRGVGTKNLVAQIRPHVRLHDTRVGAVKRAREQCDSARPPEFLGLRLEAPETQSGIIKNPAAGCTVESLGDAVLVRVRSENLAEAIFKLRSHVVPNTDQDVLLAMTGVTQISSSELLEIASLAEGLQGIGRSLRIVSPEPIVARELEEAGLGHLVAESREPEEGPTKASS